MKKIIPIAVDFDDPVAMKALKEFHDKVYPKNKDEIITGIEFPDPECWFYPDNYEGCDDLDLIHLYLLED